jgi:hypothetical protein
MERDGKPLAHPPPTTFTLRRRVRQFFREGSVLRRVAFVVMCAGFACAQAPAALGASGTFKFSGSTKQCPAEQGRCADVAIRVASNLKRVTSFFAEYQAGCQTAATPVADSISASNFPATVAGHSLKFKHDAATALDLGNGFTGDVTAKLAGKIRAASGNGSGTLQVDVAVKNGSGQQVDTCTTGAVPIRWKVKVV